ncbi:flagellar export chaperone FlgN [Desulfobacula sp.]|uniref:flagellar export chaperone FlgN n=1 Tax=Desulfobacula sp. TaxID=2593537 RepID=UPI00261F924A|nr:flagellar export chaperone FlgN [Desulfobacula sp.]
MEKRADKIENLLGETLFLYKELIDVLEQEKKHIVDMDVDSLWETIAHKRQMAAALSELTRQLQHLVEQNAPGLGRDSTAVNLSDFIKQLPVSPGVKSRLRRDQMALEACKKEVSLMAVANKAYIQHRLGVIGDIFATVVETVNKNQYNHTGSYSGSKEKKRLINAEV